MKVCNSKNFSCILVAASLLFTSLFFSCSNGSSGSGGSDPTTTPATNNPGGGSGGGSGGGGTPPAPTTLNSITNPITLSVTIPATTEYVEIIRQQVDASHNPVSGKGKEKVGVLSFSNTDPDFNTNKNKKFTDLFGVVNGATYKYELFARIAGGTTATSHLDYRTANYNGLTPPSFGTGDAYPEIKYTNNATKKLNLNNVNNVNIMYHNSEELQTNYWKLNLTYNWCIEHFFDNNPSNAEWTIPSEVITSAPTGDNHITDISLELKFSNDNNCDFVRVIHLDTASIDGSKIDKKIFIKGPELNDPVTYSTGFYAGVTEKSISLKIKYPQNNPRIRDIFIQRRVHSENEWERTPGYLDNRTTDYSVGYVNEAELHGAINEYGFLTFTDRWGFPSGVNSYDYRAIIRTGENFEETELALGTTTADERGGTSTPAINMDYLSHSWNSATQTLTINQSISIDQIVPFLSASSKFALMATYLKDGDESKGFYPMFKFGYGEGNISSNTVPNNLGNSYTLNVASCNLIFVSNSSIGSMIKLDINSIGSQFKKQLTYPAN